MDLRLVPLAWGVGHPEYCKGSQGCNAMVKRTDAETRIDLSHLSFEEAVSALVQDDSPMRKDSEAEGSCSTKLGDPEAAPSEKQTAPSQTPSADSA